MREEPYLVQPASRLLYSAYTLLKNNLYWPRLNGSFYRIFRMWSTCLLTTCNSWIFNDFFKEMYWKYNGIFRSVPWSIFGAWYWWGMMVWWAHFGLVWYPVGCWWPYRVININMTRNDLTRLDEDILSA